MKPYPRYKPTGLAWLPSVPEHWEVTKIKHLFREVDERNTMLEAPLLSFSRSKGIVPYSEVSEKDPSAGDLSLYKVIRPGLLLENRLQAWSGMFAASNIYGCVSPDYSVFKPSANANLRFYEYVFRSPFQVSQFANASRGVGEGFNRLYTPQFGAILTVLPPPDEQTRIVQYLDEKTAAIDELVRAKERQIELLRERKQALVSAAVTRGLDPATKLKDSGVPWIGKIPAHWEVTKIKHLFQEVDERNTMLDAPLLSFSRTRGIIPFSELSEKDPAAGDLSLYKIIRPGLLLENRLQAWSGMFAASNAFGCVSPDYSVFKPSTNANIRFYEFVFRSPFQVSQFANASRGVGEGFNRLYTPQFGAILTVLPPFPEQARIVAYLDERTAAIDELVRAEERQIELLQELRIRLVSDAVTGAVEVS